ncbi:MAG: hypothetical protein ABI442_03360 [Gemmatimonadaceae bacterium]
MRLVKRKDARGARSGRRSGFTLLEVIAAIILIDVGLLALVAGSAVLVRETTRLRARTVALRTAANRLEVLGVARCEAASGDSTLADGTQESWSAALEPNAVRELRDSVTFPFGATTRSLVLRTRLPC